MSSSQFSTLQKLALAAIVMGGIMCLVGLLVPYWAVFGIDGAEGDLGLWMLCGKIWKVSSCGIIPFFLTDIPFHVARGTAVLCVLIGIAGGLSGLCMACCCQGRTVCVGITCFVAGAFGATTLGIFISKLDDFVSMLNFSGVELARYGWGLYVFGAGFVILALASFVACFAAPVNPPVGYIVGTSSPTVMVAQSSSNTNMSNTYQPYPPASYPPSAYPPSAYPPSAYPPSAYPPNTCSPNPVSDSSSICTSEMPRGGYSTSGKVLD